MVSKLKKRNIDNIHSNMQMIHLVCAYTCFFYIDPQQCLNSPSSINFEYSNFLSSIFLILFSCTWVVIGGGWFFQGPKFYGWWPFPDSHNWWVKLVIYVVFSIFLSCQCVTFWPLQHNILAIYPHSREKRKWNHIQGKSWVVNKISIRSSYLQPSVQVDLIVFVYIVLLK
jgi:hypothetical protein